MAVSIQFVQKQPPFLQEDKKPWSLHRLGYQKYNLCIQVLLFSWWKVNLYFYHMLYEKKKIRLERLSVFFLPPEKQTLGGHTQMWQSSLYMKDIHLYRWSSRLWSCRPQWAFRAAPAPHTEPFLLLWQSAVTCCPLTHSFPLRTAAVHARGASAFLRHKMDDCASSLSMILNLANVVI